MFESQRKLLFETPSSVIYPRKLDTAMRGSTTQAFRSRIQEKTINFEDQLISSHFTINNLIEAPDGPHCYALILEKLFHDSNTGRIRYTNTEVSWLRKGIISTNCNMEIQTAWMLENAELPLRLLVFDKLLEQKDQVTLPLVFENLGWLTHEMAKIVQRVYKIDAPHLLKEEPLRRLERQLLVNQAVIPFIDVKLT